MVLFILKVELHNCIYNNDVQCMTSLVSNGSHLKFSSSILNENMFITIYESVSTKHTNLHTDNYNI
jgi:hypothetical protein